MNERYCFYDAQTGRIIQIGSAPPEALQHQQPPAGHGKLERIAIREGDLRTYDVDIAGAKAIRLKPPEPPPEPLKEPR